MEPLVNTTRSMEAHINRRMSKLEGLLKTVIVIAGLCLGLAAGCLLLLAIWEWRYQQVMEELEQVRQLMNRR